MSTQTLSPIPLLNVAKQTAALRSEIDAAIGRVLDHGQFILGPEVAQLEERIAQYCGTRFAISCASGSDALLLPLMALDAKPGDTVITTPFSFFATAGSIARLGADPVFVDIEPDSFNLDPAALTRLLESFSKTQLAAVRAIMPVHLFGQCADMSAIQAVANRFGIPIIEDAAQAIGAKWAGSPAGSMGYCGSFSFFPSKNLGGPGDGGIITTNDEELAAKLRLLRVHGSGATYYHKFVGINSRLDTLQAAVLLVKLRYLDAWIEGRRNNAAAYREYFEEAPANGIRLPAEIPGAFHVYNQFTVRVQNRDQVKARLADTGTGCAVYYPLPLHLQECFQYLGYSAGDFPVAEAAAREVLSIPVEPGLGVNDIRTAAERLKLALS